MSKKSLDDLFRDAFDAPTEAPSNAIWQRLEKRLDDRRAERRKARRIRFLQPGVVILTVALLLLAGLAGWFFVKNHKAKISPKPLIYRELGWLEGNWYGINVSTNWTWVNDSTLVNEGFDFDSGDWHVFPNKFFQRNDSLFFAENGSICMAKLEKDSAAQTWFFDFPAGKSLRLVHDKMGGFEWLDAQGKRRHGTGFVKYK